MSDSQSTSSSALKKAGSSITTRHSDESRRKIDLIGNTSHQITGAKLPSNRQVLQVLFYNMRFVNMKPEAKESARLAIKTAVFFWEQARIPTRRVDKCVDQLLQLYKKWKNIQKNAPEKRTGPRKEVENAFVDILDDVFDIAAENALEVMRNEEDQNFLTMQRQKGRPGCMAGVDMALFAKEKRSLEREEMEQLRKKKHETSACGTFISSIHQRDRNIY